MLLFIQAYLVWRTHAWLTWSEFFLCCCFLLSWQTGQPCPKNNNILTECVVLTNSPFLHAEMKPWKEYMKPKFWLHLPLIASIQNGLVWNLASCTFGLLANYWLIAFLSIVVVGCPVHWVLINPSYPFTSSAFRCIPMFTYIFIMYSHILKISAIVSQFYFSLYFHHETT